MGSAHLADRVDTFSTLTLAIIDCECFAAVREVSCREMPRDTLVLSRFTTCCCSAVIDENLNTIFFGGAGGGGGGGGGRGGGGGDGGRGGDSGEGGGDGMRQ